MTNLELANPKRTQQLELEVPQPAVLPQVTIIADACCEVAPATAAALGITLLPRVLRIDGRERTLDSEQTLHASCWEQRPRGVVLMPQSIGPLAEAYSSALSAGRSVLAIRLPGRIDAGTRQAQAARSILLAGRDSSVAGRRRIGVIELGHAGRTFGLLVELAAQAAAEGLALHQVVTLLDQAQSATRSWVLSTSTPAAGLRLPTRAVDFALPGTPALWQLDPAQGLFSRQARSRDLARRLFAPAAALHELEPQLFGPPASPLVKALNEGRAAQTLAALQFEPGGLSLLPFFGPSAVELAVLPPADYIERIRAVIRRVESPALVVRYGVGQRGGL